MRRLVVAGGDCSQLNRNTGTSLSRKGAKIDDVDDVDKMENVCYYSVMQTS